MRALFERTIAVLLCVLIARTWFAQAYLVSTGSMADAFLGRHRQVRCTDCDFEFAVGSSPEDALPTQGARAICPNCDFANELDRLPDQPGDYLFADRAAWAFQSPQRSEAVLLHDPTQASQILLKRIVGLPGETIALRNGNVWANGALVRKSLSQQRELAILVHDAAHRSRDPSFPLRWNSSRDSSGWKYDTGIYRFAAEVASLAATSSSEKSASASWLESEHFDWLEYHHYRRLPGREPRFAPAPIDNAHGYNQGIPLVDASPVNELFLAFAVQCSDSSQIAVRARVANAEWMVVIQPQAGRAQLHHDGRVDNKELPRIKDSFQIEVTTFDRQFLCAIDRHVVFAVPCETVSQQPTHFAIGARGDRLSIRELKLFRDVYYTNLRGPQHDHSVLPSYHLGPHEYFLLGDNSAISRDSREWSDSPAAPRSLLIGKALRLNLGNTLGSVLPARTARPWKSTFRHLPPWTKLPIL